MIEEGHNLSYHETKAASSFVIYTVASPTLTSPFDPAFLKNASVFPSTPMIDPAGLAAIKNHPLVGPFLSQQAEPFSILAHYTEILEPKRQMRWLVLQQALQLCQQQSATLIIAELGNLASQPYFTQRILDANIPFHCCDQPFVDKSVLVALHKHAQVQKKLHGDLIKKGLQSTSAKSGNPNAAQVISKVNKPKIDTAILFAFILSPLLKKYSQLSQRQLVKQLNDEGFTAPEGGKWVLSQLQKVLDRVRLNELADTLRKTQPTLCVQGQSPEAFSEKLTHQGIPSLKRGGWTSLQAQKLLQRLKQIEEICTMNALFLQLLPILQHVRKHQLPLQRWCTPLPQQAKKGTSPENRVDSAVISL